MVTSSFAPARKVSKVEALKENSNYLREPLAQELGEDTTHFSEDAVQILKFHGSYQQDNRDNRVKGQDKDYQFMLRTRNPGGFIPPQLYIALDDLASQYGNQTLRITTRQGLQVHGILKKDLKTAIATIVRNMGSTLGACGDINRNVMAPPAPFRHRPEYGYAQTYAEGIADLLSPQTGAYYEIWLDGEKIISAEEAPEVRLARQRSLRGVNLPDEVEPIYGAHYMPRKFKCSVTVPGDNSIDVLTHDISLVVMTNSQGELEGFNILAGGGLGRTHNKEETFPRAADAIGYVPKERVYDLVKAIVATQRDYGDRHNRRHARMKYLLADWGVEKFKAQVETYLGQAIEPFRPLPAWQYEDYLGWHEQGDGKWFLGLSIENGRIKDEGELRLKTALRQLAEQYHLPMRLTANHNVILYEIEAAQCSTIEALLQEHGLISDPNRLDPLTRYAMACPALPTCGLAVTESERILPQVTQRISQLLYKLGLGEESFVIRMTGCPNGCARPYMAELGFVGSAPDAYQIWLGGTPHQTALAQAYTDKLPLQDLEQFLEPLLVFFKKERQQGESFGEFCQRVGFESLRQFSESYNPSQGRRRRRKNQHRVGVPDDLFAQLKAVAHEQERPMNQIIQAALESYFSQQ